MTAPTRDDCLDLDIGMFAGRINLHDGRPETRTTTANYRLAKNFVPTDGKVHVFLPELAVDLDTGTVLNTRFDDFLAQQRAAVRQLLVVRLDGMDSPVTQRRAEIFAEHFGLPVALPRTAVTDPLSPRLAGFDSAGRQVPVALATYLRVLPTSMVDTVAPVPGPVPGSNQQFARLRDALLRLPSVDAGDAVTVAVLRALERTYASDTSAAKHAINGIGRMLSDEVRYTWIGNLTGLIDESNEAVVMRVATLVAYCYDEAGLPLGI